MPNYYAQINEEGRVIALSDLGEQVESEYLIPIDENQFKTPSLLRMRYVGEAFTGIAASFKTDKESIIAGGTDTMTVEVVLTDWQGRTLEDEKAEISVDLNGVQQSVSVSKGRASLTVSSDEPGEFKLRTLGLDRNAELKVVVTDGK